MLYRVEIDIDTGVITVSETADRTGFGRRIRIPPESAQELAKKIAAIISEYKEVSELRRECDA